MFRYKNSVPLGYDLQGYIYFLSKLYKKLPKKRQEMILSACMTAGGEYYQALFEFVTSDVGATAVCMKHFLSQSTLERIVRKYYIEMSKSI